MKLDTADGTVNVTKCNGIGTYCRNAWCHQHMIGNQVLYSSVLISLTLHARGEPEADIFVFKFLPWPGFEPRTSQSNGRERNHSTTATPPHSGYSNRSLIPMSVLFEGRK